MGEIFLLHFWPLIRVLNKDNLQNYLHNPRANSRDDSNEVFDRTITGNHWFINLISFVTQSYTYLWKGFANRLYLVLHA
jgi:hypothetical protein